MRAMLLAAALCCAALLASAQVDDPQRPVILRLEPQPKKPMFMEHLESPHPVAQQPPQQQRQPLPAAVPQQPPAMMPQPQPRPAVVPPMPAQTQRAFAPQLAAAMAAAAPQQPAAALPTLPPVPMGAQQPILQASASGQQFTPRDIVTPPPAPPVNIPPDVQNQLIKFFGLDSFGIPGLTGNHPNGFAGAVQELRAAGIPVQGLPVEHVGGQALQAPQSDVLVQANPNFASDFNNLVAETRNGGPFHAGGGAGMPLPDAKPGENGLIGLLSSSIRKLVKDSGMAEALSQGIPTVLGTGPTTGTGSSSSASGASASSLDSSAASLASAVRSPLISAASTDAEAVSASVDRPAISSGNGIRRQQSAAERALSGLTAALGGGGNSPTHAGLPRIPGIPLLPGGIPRNAQGQIDVVNLIGSITRRISNGTTLADIMPPEQLQTLADNVTDALLPATPEDFNLNKFMGRWFEGINSPRATEQRCVVHHYGGLTKNDKTATFTALKIYREGSEFGPVRYSIGYAFRAGNKDAMLQLHSSDSADAQPFWVYKLGPEGTDPFGNKQYEYAIVSNWVKYPVTVLVRDPDTFKNKYEVEVLRWLEDQGFVNGFVRAFNLLQPATYSSCQYADNTFELFGR